MTMLPAFKPDQSLKRWIDYERVSAKVIQLLWRHASKADRSDPYFLEVLIRSSWSNGGSDEASLLWRNRHLAEWLGFHQNASDKEIVRELRERLGMTTRNARWLVSTPSGITDYYKPYRNIFLRRVRKHTQIISKAFHLVSEHDPDIEAKVECVADLMFSLPTFRARNKARTSMMNGVAPALACLDPQSRFPIMNARTRSLLSALGRSTDSEGAKSLSRLIGHYGITDSFSLDVYASTQKFKASKRTKKIQVRNAKSVGVKAEEAAIANLAKRKVVIRKRHNALINRFRQAVEWKYSPKESEYDLLIEGWKRGRWLLIEAKSETAGVVGRTQLRQAIGQLFDYRWRSFKDRTDIGMDKIDLAVLTPSKPEHTMLDLLDHLGIEALWFERGNLRGTITLI